MIRIINEGKLLPHRRATENTTFRGLAGKP